MTRRSYCRCAAIKNQSYEEAAKKLGCLTSWLQANISRLPHQKYGGAPAVFCDCELALIQAMYTVLPDGALEVLRDDAQQDQGTPEPKALRTLQQIRPSGARPKTAVS